MRKTKIICTIGPATWDREMFKKLVNAGLDVVRLNFSHENHEVHQRNLNMIKEVRNEMNAPFAILLDTKGPEVRIKTFENESIFLNEGDTFSFTSKDIIGNQEIVSVNYANLEKEVKAGDTMLLNNGLLNFKVVDVKKDKVITTVVEGGKLSDRKGINFPNKVLDLPYMSEQDKADIKLGVENDVDFIACSFVSTAQNVIDVRNYINSLGGENIDIIAKIENRSGVDNLEHILEHCEGIMVARGDMGVEIPYEELAPIQKKLIMTARMAGKRVITATEMLESMISNLRPTRAEISDVANAVYDGTSAVMLSGETAMGKYPIETVQAMVKIVSKTEENIKYKKRYINNNANFEIRNSVDAVSHATCTMAHDIDAKSIVVCTRSGATARMVSRFRSPVPILALTTDVKAWRKLSLSWGVTAELIDEVTSTDVLFYVANQKVKDLGFATSGQSVVITVGAPIGTGAETNLIKVEVVK